jgi:hypothetical protein
MLDLSGTMLGMLQPLRLSNRGQRDDQDRLGDGPFQPAGFDRDG